MASPEKNSSIDISHAISLLKNKGLIKNQQFHSSSSKAGVIRTDSRMVEAGDIFIAYLGESIDSHNFIPAVVTKNPGLIIIEDDSFIKKLGDTPWVLVENSREAWSYLCAEANDFFNLDMIFIGVTGTNGKTSTVWIIKELLRQSQIPHISIGTLGIWTNDHFTESRHTSPDPDVLYPVLANAATQGIRLCVMEVSSHAMQQNKLSPIKFSASAFTSFSRDHLDLHGDMDSYLAAKLKFFTHLQSDNSYKLFHSSLFSIPTVSKLKTTNLNKYALGNNLSYVFEDGVSRLQIKSSDSSNKARTFNLPLLGSFLIENAAAAILLLESVLKTKIDPKFTMGIRPIPGRLELVSKQLPVVVVDYAHTPDAIEKSLQALRPFCSGNLWVVFGCGGNRDKGKRPLMAKAAEQFSDKVVVTSDNPRDEDPNDIIQEILVGFSDSSNVSIEADRKNAIESTISEAQKNDLILIAGKGHETYMEIKGEKLPFNDMEIAKAALRG